MAPRALAASTIAAFASNEDIFALLVSDVLNGDKISKDTTDAVNFVFLRHFGLFTTLQERSKFKKIWQDLEVCLDAPNLREKGMMSLAKLSFTKAQIANNF